MLESPKLAFEYLSLIGTILLRFCSRRFNGAEDANDSVIGAALKTSDNGNVYRATTAEGC